MKVIFLGAMVPPDRIAQCSGLSIAGNKMQYNIAMHLAKHSDVKLCILSELPLAPFPKDKRIVIKKYRTALWDDTEYIEVPYINIPILKQVLQIRGFIRAAKKRIDSDTVLLSMNLFPYNGCAFVKLRQKYGLKSAAILADLPIDDNYTRKGISKIFRKKFDDITKRNIQKCNDFIVLNKFAVESYAPDANYIIMEGGIDAESVTEEQGYSDRKNIVYSGALSDYSGILELIRAMDYITDENIILEIYGSGKLEREIAQIALKNDKIVLKGRVTNDEMMAVQRSAWLLVNPRPVDDPIARVTFPSKIFEYMISGTPVLTTKLNGFTEEYLDKMFFVENNQPQAIAEKIMEISKTEKASIDDMTRKAKRFVLQEKNWEKQTDKIYDFLKCL